MAEEIKNRFCDPEAERGLLGIAIQEPKEYLRKAAALPEDIFHDPKNRALHRALRSMAEAGQSVDLINVDNYMRTHDHGTDWSEELTRLIECPWLTVNFSSYVKLAEDAALRREMYKAGKAIMEKAGGPEDILDTRDWAARLIRDMRTGNGVKLITMGDACEAAYLQIEEAQRKDGEKPGRVLSGITGLDDLLGGFRAGEYVALGARPSVGKSILALTVCAHAARQGKRVLMVSLEMNEVQITERLLAEAGDIPLSEITSDRVTDEGWRKLGRAVGPLSYLPIFFSMEANTVDKVRRAAYQVMEDGGLDLIAIDYLQLMEAANAKKQNRQEQIAEISRGLRLLAAELKIPVLVLTQLNRNSVSDRAGPRREPSMSEARESGAIEQDANVFLLMHMPGREEMRSAREKNTWDWLANQGMIMLTLIIDKNRQGKRGRVNVAFDGDHMRFLPLDRMHDAADESV